MSKLCLHYDRLVRLLGGVAWLPPLVARITLGWIFIESGWGKLHNLDNLVAYFRDKLHLPAAQFQAPLAAGTELVCGVLVLIGLFTRLASLPLIVVMTVAILTAKRTAITTVSDLFGMEEYLFIVLLVWLVVSGAGRVSVDRFLVRAMRHPPAA